MKDIQERNEMQIKALRSVTKKATKSKQEAINYLKKLELYEDAIDA